MTNKQKASSIVVWDKKNTTINIFTPTEMVGLRLQKLYSLKIVPSHPAISVGVSHLNTRQSAVRRLPEQDDEGETTPNNPANAKATGV